MLLVWNPNPVVNITLSTFAIIFALIAGYFLYKRKRVFAVIWLSISAITIIVMLELGGVADLLVRQSGSGAENKIEHIVQLFGMLRYNCNIPIVYEMFFWWNITIFNKMFYANRIVLKISDCGLRISDYFTGRLNPNSEIRILKFTAIIFGSKVIKKRKVNNQRTISPPYLWAVNI